MKEVIAKGSKNSKEILHKAEKQKSISSHFAARNSGKATIPKPEIRATNYCFFPMGPGFDFPLIMNYTDTGYEEPYFYFLNGHGDVTYFSDANFIPEQTESYEYAPWGVLLTSSNKNNLLYTSREFDFDAGLQFNRMRYYSPNLGRFCEKDFLFQDNNYYECTGNSPIIFKDPFGLLPPWLGRFFWVNIVLPGSLPIGWCAEPECGCSCEDLPNYYLCFAAYYCKEDYQWRWCICCPYA